MGEERAVCVLNRRVVEEDQRALLRRSKHGCRQHHRNNSKLHSLRRVSAAGMRGSSRAKRPSRVARFGSAVLFFQTRRLRHGAQNSCPALNFFVMSFAMFFWWASSVPPPICDG